MVDIKAIIFDLGGVLIDWNPRYVYRQIFKTEEEVEWFLLNVTTSDWNEQQDAGYPTHKATEELIAKHPEWETEIKAYYGRWLEMLGEALHDTVEVFRKLKETGKYKLYALTNWSAETFPHAKQRFEFLSWFDGIVVSGEEKLRKPFPEFYKILLDRYKLSAAETLFIDDNLRNVKAAAAIGMETIYFSDPQQFILQLNDLGIDLRS
jgi:2-haloacid dehalogenase